VVLLSTVVSAASGSKASSFPDVMAEAVLAQALASKSILQAMAGRAVFRKVSSAEKVKLTSLLNGSKLTSEEMASILKVVLSAGFDHDDQNELIDTVGGCMCATSAGPTSGAVMKVQRASLQSWESLGNFLPSTVWAKLSDGSLDCLLAFLIKMGLRFPTEPTVATMTLLSLHKSDPEGLAGMSPDARLAHVRACKQAFKSKCKFEGPPEVWVEKLPSSAAEFKESYPILFEKLFSTEEPAQCPLGELTLAQMRAGTRLRGLRGQSSAATVNSGVDVMMQFGHAMMQQMSLMNKEMAQMRAKPNIPLTFIKRHRAALPAPWPTQAAIADSPRPTEAEPIESDDEEVEASPPAAVETPPTAKKVSVDAATTEIERAIHESATSGKKKGKNKGKAKGGKKSQVKKAAVPIGCAKGKKQPGKECKMSPGKKAALGCSKCRYSKSGCAQCKP